MILSPHLIHETLTVRAVRWVKKKFRLSKIKNVFCQGLAELNQIFAGSIDGVDNMLVKNFDCCFLRPILTTVMLKIEKYGLRVLIWPLIDVLLPKSRPWGRISWLWFIKVIKVSVFVFVSGYFSAQHTAFVCRKFQK